MLWNLQANAPVTPPAEKPEINHFIHAFLSVIVWRRPEESPSNARWEDRARTYDTTGRRVSGRNDTYPQHMFYSAHYTGDEFTAELWNPTTCWNPVPFLGAHTMASSRKRRSNDLGFPSLNLQTSRWMGAAVAATFGSLATVPALFRSFRTVFISYARMVINNSPYMLKWMFKYTCFPISHFHCRIILSLKIMPLRFHAISTVHCKKINVICFDVFPFSFTMSQKQKWPICVRL